MVKHRESSKRIGQNLKSFRIQKGLMQMDVAAATGLNRSYVSRIESGKARVSLSVLAALCKGLKIHSSELIGDEND